MSGTVVEASARPKWGFEASLTLLSPREVRGRSLRTHTAQSLAAIAGWGASRKPAVPGERCGQQLIIIPRSWGNEYVGPVGGLGCLGGSEQHPL